MNAKDVESEIPYGDFGRDVAQTVKLQIDLFLNYMVKSVKNKEERRNRYLLPLKYLLCYVKNSGFQDILKMDVDQEAEIALMLRKQMGESNVNATKFIAFCRKTLFLEAKEINWEANVWYVEKLNISPERYSLSSTIDSFSFLDIRTVILLISRRIYCYVGNSPTASFLPHEGKKNFLPFAQRSEVLFPCRTDCLGLVDGKPFQKPAVFLPGKVPYFRRISGPLEAPVI